MKLQETFVDSSIIHKALEVSIPVISAGAAIVPAYFGLVAKSALQLGNPIPVMSHATKLKEGIKAVPITAAVVGSQMALQSVIAQAFSKKSESHSFVSTFLSAALVAGLSAPLLTMFNGKTMGLSFTQSLKATNVRQIAAIIARETSFIFSLKLSGPMTDYMKSKNLTEKPYEIMASFISGAVGSALGHPADTALTMWQKGMKIDSYTKLNRGLATKSVAVGLFSVVYNLTESSLKYAHQKHRLS